MKRENSSNRPLGQPLKAWVQGMKLLLTFIVCVFTQVMTTTDALSQVSPGCVQPPAGLVSWWPGDGNANDIIDANHGTLQNGATFAPGKVGQAFRFDGVDDYVDAGTSNVFNFNNGSGDFTIDAWIIPAGMPTYGSVIVAKATESPYSGWGFYFYSDGRLGFASEGAWDVTSLPGTITANKWAHVAITKFRAIYKLYKDGVEVKFMIREKKLETSTTSLKIGQYYPDGSPHIFSNFNGLIDEVAIYSRALTASEIQAIFNAGSAGKCTTVAPPPTTTTTVPPTTTTTTIPPPTITTTIPPVSENPQLKFSVNSQTVSPGQRFTLELNTFQGTKDVVVDLYVALMLPDGKIFFFTGNFLELFTPKLVPFQQGIRVTDRKFEILNVTIPPELAGFGNITFLAAYIRAGRPVDLFNIVGNIEQIVITIR